MRRAFVLGLLVLAAMPATAGSTDEERVLRIDYDTSAPGPFLSASVPTPVEEIGAGGTELELEPGEARVEVFVLDVSHRKVPGRIVFYDDAGEQLLLEDFCFTTDVQVPEDAVRVTVHPSPLVYPCPLAGVHGPAVRGELLVTTYGPGT